MDGLCVPTCPSGAMRMVPKEHGEDPPANILEMNAKLLRDRGLMP